MAGRRDALAIGSDARPVSERPKLRAFYEADSLHTEIYDALGASLVMGSPVDGDTDFYRRLAGETGGPILEVGCGTGRVATALAADGHEVVGVDLSTPMLRLAEQRRGALSADAAARLSFQLADMTTLDLGRDFALIVTPARVFQFMLTSAAQRQALAALRTHLRPNGRLVLDLFDPRLDRVVPSAGVTTRGGELIHPTTGNRVTWKITGRVVFGNSSAVTQSQTTAAVSPSPRRQFLFRASRKSS